MIRGVDSKEPAYEDKSVTLAVKMGGASDFDGNLRVRREGGRGDKAKDGSWRKGENRPPLSTRHTRGNHEATRVSRLIDVHFVLAARSLTTAELSAREATSAAVPRKVAGAQGDDGSLALLHKQSHVMHLTQSNAERVRTFP